ncbi:hypothetical protein Metev_2311 (plasmid) [Methanohalobium evestigatum Z-7303]|uniref:Uncharacterized protein n=1 Tax=Methanohalobium evestigatum (strain ATCC BAA-1072 / DSM 3721 / NBRC 107634 / OCM 161 / Z-7303) TaxID=644295 RepID=D7EC01_METEZ|nr:hypothetical protein [Methanohalobium evestigatum]ADI75123.1 hypothetical protein Metev_2311 [Methanohalobium evestigatum Z-7303]
MTDKDNLDGPNQKTSNLTLKNADKLSESELKKKIIEKYKENGYTIKQLPISKSSELPLS